MAAVQQTIDTVDRISAYTAGFSSDEIEQEFAPRGLNEGIVRYISEKKAEPQWMLDWRLEALDRRFCRAAGTCR